MNENEIVKKLSEMSNAYYLSGESVDDIIFDSLLDLLKSINPSHPLLTDVGHGLTLSGIDDKEKFNHPLPMGSITKEKSLNDARNWCKKSATFTTKIDGNSVAAYYREGKLWKVVTRGKEDVGIDRTAKFFSILPKTIPVLGYVRVRGEAAIKKSVYTISNGFDLSKSSRNAVAGAISRKTDWESVFKYVDFIAYTFQDCDNGDDISSSIVWSDYFKVEEQKDISEFLTANISDFKKKYKDDYEYDSDGIVLKNLDGDLLAFKFEDESAVTKLNDIRWTVGKDQRMTPTGLIEPVNLSGGLLSKASFGSFAKVLEKNCWPIKKDHYIKIIRSGEIIPFVVDTVWTSNEEVFFNNPSCPHCGSIGVVDGEHIFCKNEDCPNIEDKRLYNFSSNYYVDGLGDSVMEKVFEHLSINTVEDLLKYKGTFNSYIDGIGDSNINKIQQFFSNVRKPIDVRILYKTYLKNCGDRASEKIVDSGFDIFNFVEKGLEAIKLYSISNFDGNIINDMEAKREIFKSILSLVDVEQVKKEKVAGTFCITGARFKEEEKTYLLSKGWGEDKDLKTSTNVLVVKDTSKSSGKTEKAKKYGTKIMSIEEFLAYVG